MTRADELRRLKKSRLKLSVVLGLIFSLSACEGLFTGFDRAAWAAGKGNYGGKNPREGMLDDARAAGLVVGATHVQVRTLLGEPDASDSGGDIWYMGQASYTIDFCWLEVEYDTTNRVRSVEERCDG